MNTTYIWNTSMVEPIKSAKKKAGFLPLNIKRLIRAAIIPERHVETEQAILV